MVQNIDVRQVRALTRFALKSEWRQASTRSFGRRRKMKRGWAIWTMLLYLGAGAVTVRLFKGNIAGPAFVVAASLDLLFLAFITASNIFLSFGSGFLSPDETQMVAPMPISSETFFLSRLTVLLAYTWTITLLFVLGPCIAFPLWLGGSIAQSIWFFVTALISNASAAMAVIVLYGLVLKKLPQQTLAKTIGYVQFIGSFVTSFSFVILPRVERNLDLSLWTLSAKPFLAIIPVVWYGALAGLAAPPLEGLQITLAIVSILFLAALAWASHMLLGKNYVGEVSELALSSVYSTKQSKRKRDSAVFRLFMQFARSHEARAVFMLLRAQFKYDQKFRMSILATLPITILYLILSIVQGGIRDPFTGDFKTIIGGQFLYLFALLMPLVVMQAVSQSENYKAAWIFFVAPLDRSKLLFAVRNTLIVSIIIPYMVALGIIFSFFIPAVHAAEHVLVLAAIAGFIFQAFLLFAPKMPFAQHRRPNRTNVATILGVGFFAGAALLILGLEIHFGYRTPVSFWSSFALIVTLSLLLEQVVRTRVRKKLDREEFEG